MSIKLEDLKPGLKIYLITVTPKDGWKPVDKANWNPNDYYLRGTSAIVNGYNLSSDHKLNIFAEVVWTRDQSEPFLSLSTYGDYIPSIYSTQEEVDAQIEFMLEYAPIAISTKIKG